MSEVWKVIANAHLYENEDYPDTAIVSCDSAVEVTKVVMDMIESGIEPTVILPQE